MFKLKYKKGGEKLLSIWWFAVLAIVGAALVAAVIMHYSASVNVKEIEADLLSERLAGCMNEGGYLREGFLQADFDVMKECGLSKAVIDMSFYIRIVASDENGKELKKFEEGDGSLEKDCAVTSGGTISARNFPSCTTKKASLLISENGAKKVVNLKIYALSNQNGGRVVSK